MERGTIQAATYPNGRIPFRCRCCGAPYEERGYSIVGFADKDGVYLGYCDPCARATADNRETWHGESQDFSPS